MSADTYLCNLGRLFEQTALRNIRAPAIRLDKRDVQYGELAALTKRQARWLLDRDVGRGCVVALQTSKTLAGYAAMLACLQVGAAYTNLDVRNPYDRIF